MVALLALWAESPLPTLDATVRSGECVMTLPVVDKESYKFSFSEWVMYAGQALQQAGFLQSDPTGHYDEEFTAALAAFQAFHGIVEEDHVGPYTWAALGIQDTGHTEEHAGAGHAGEHAVQAGTVSEDGQWHWDGAQWLPAEQHHADVAVEGF